MSIATLLPLCKKEFLENFRTYRFLIAIIVFLLMGISGPIITELTPDLLKNLGDGITIVMPPQTATDAINSYLKNLSQLPPLVFILLAMGSIADERSRGTAVTVLTKPVPHTIFVLAKFLNYELLLLISIILAAAGGYYYTALFFGAPDIGIYLLLNVALLSFLSIVLALTILASTLFRSNVAAGGLAFIGFLALYILPSLSNVVNKILPTALLSPQHVKELITHTLPIENIWLPLVIGFGGTILLIILACISFQHQEI